ncbi:MAG: Ig-like domain-containing protein [Chitinophagaceae bacterium]|nr:Ig-like domain-containing protein [Chitinophagaceae bacterium]
MPPSPLQRPLKRLVFLCCLVLLVIAVAPRCGQPIPPTGGPRDSLPPMLTGAQPADSTVNFRGNRITLQFDEYITLENPFEKLSYSPLPKTNPQAEGKLKTVTIKLKDSLEPNTTYSIDFGDAIQDINENNALRDFRYVFSTGPKIDSGLIRGRVFLAENGKTDSTLVVVLHRSSDDSAVAKERPRYATRINRDGEFVFRYLAAGDYAIFALKDIDGGKKYDQKSEAIGFLDKRVVADQDEPVILYAFTESPEPVKPPPPPAPGAAGVEKSKDDKRLRYSLNLDANKLDILGDLVLTSENKLASYDSSKLILSDEKFMPIPAYTLLPDSTGRKLTVKHSWIEGRKYNLIIQRDFAKDTAGNFVSRTDTLAIQAKDQSDYGSLSIRILNLDSNANPILQFYRDEKAELSLPLRLDRYNIRLFRPGEYEVRVLYDRNGNGTWDTGNYWEKKQPERVVARKQKMSIRQNWDNELEINLQELQEQ